MKQRLHDLPIEKRTLLMRRLRERREAGATSPAAEPAIAALPREAAGCPSTFPASFSQLRLWLLQQLDPASTAYHLLDEIEVEAVSAGAAEAALARLLARHESLRTTFREEGGEPLQVVRPPGRVPVPVVDLRGLEPEARDGQRAEAARQLAEPAFDLAAGPLWRSAIVLVEDGAAAWCFCFHHIVYDGWSSAVLRRELAALLQGEADLAPLPIQYADYACWQRERLQGERLEPLLGYWRGRLDGLSVLDLPTDRPHPAGRSGGVGARFSWAFPDGLADGLRQLARSRGVSLFVALLAGFQTLFGRLAGTDDVAVGSPVANRDRPETQGLIGFFVNTLVLRTDLSGAPSFTALLDRVRDVCQGAFAHQELPFEMLVREKRPVDVLLSLESMPEAPAALAVSAETPEPEPVPGVQFDLVLSLVDSPGSLQAVVEYRTDLWDIATLARWLRCAETLLGEAARRPDLPLDQLAWLTPEERRQALLAGNDTDTDFPRDRTVPELFAEQAALRPDAEALRFGEESVTYRDLAARAATLAARLRAHGAGRGARVGILLDSSPGLVTAMLAVLQTGAAYVPIETAAPPERRRRIADEADLAAVILEAGPAEGLEGIPAVALEGREAAPSPAQRGRVGEGAGPDDPAYVIFTSGSTGRPKGAVVPHRAIVRLVRGSLYLDLGPGDRVVHAASPAFDATTFEVWGPLLNGGTVVGIPQEVWLSAAELPGWLAAQRITALFITTALFHRHADERPALFQGPWSLLFGGETADPERVRRALRAGPPRRLLHVYGPTEVTTFSTFYDVSADGGEAGGPLPIGTPIGNTRACVLDDRGEPVPDGVEGELLLGGEGLAQGYLGLPALTAERFVPDPFGGTPGGRLYRTGDRVRRRPDGSLLFFGRRDHQIKLRGFRVELGEIEAALRDLPEVREALVLAREGGGGERRLAAYVVPEPGTPLDAAALAAALAHRLPRYMLPADWVMLEALPLTPNGKVDRRALPAPEAAAPGASTPPRNEAEERLARIWEQVLGVERPGVHDDFYLLGGHSLIALQVIARAREAGLSLRLADLFESPTIAGLADAAGRALPEAPAEPALVTGPYELTAWQHYFFTSCPTLTFNLLLWPLPELPGPAGLARAWRAVLHHHDGLRSRFRRCADGAWTAWLEGAPETLPLTWVDWSRLPAEEIEAELGRLPDFGHHLHVQGDESGPLLHLLALDGGEGRPRFLLLAIHHLLTDGTSNRLLEEDLLRACGQALRGEEVRLPPKTASLQAWGRRLRELADSEEILAELPYWLSDERRAAEPLPADWPAGPNTLRDARSLLLRLPHTTTRELLGVARHRLEARAEELLLAALREALAQTFAHRCGSRSVLVDLSAHGRDILPEVDLLRTVGWLSLSYPVLLDLSPSGDDPLRGLRTVQKSLCQVPRKGLGLSLLRRHRDPAVAALVAGPAAPIALNIILDGLDTLEETWAAAPGEEAEIVDHPPGDGITEVDADRDRANLIEIFISLAAGRLEAEWSYSAGRHRPETMRRLAASFARALERLAALQDPASPAPL